MSYPSPVFTMPDASTEKLPFVHSDFKARSTFAKSFGGCKRHSKLSSSMREMNVTRLPQIMYSGSDQRTLITFGSVRRGIRREYPGFQGHTKISKRKIEHEKRNYGKYNGNVKSKRTHQNYGFLPGLTPKSNESQNPSRQKEADDLGKGADDGGEDCDLYNHVHNSLESLIFVDEDNADSDRTPSPNKQQYSHAQTNNEQIDNRGLPVPSVKGLHEKSSDDRKPRQVNFQTPADSFSKELDKKINDARGNSGMKRGRRRREPDHPRMLGDVMTSKRLTELLSPRKHDAALTFS